MNNIKLGIVDDHTLFRQGIAGLLSKQPGLKVVFEAANGEELMEKLSGPKKDLPNVLLMDVQMPGMNGIEATKMVSLKYPKIKVIALTMYDNEQVIFQLLENGACGFLVKSADVSSVIEAIVSVHTKGYYLNDQTSAVMMKGAMRKKAVPLNTVLSPKETEILKIICNEHTNKEIGEMMSLSHRTIEAHKLKIQEKVGARSVVGMVLYAMNNRLIELKM
jgi:DNA-binding NarL/FixJ family response regulator